MARDHNGGNIQNAILVEEHVGEINSNRVYIAPTTFYQNLSLVSGYSFYGSAPPGSNPTVPAFRLQRETLRTGEVLLGDGVPSFIHQWSAASMASISYS